MRVSQVKGYSVSQLDEDFRSKISPSLRALYERVWDEADYVVPPAENGAFFVTTNIVITPNQTLGNCPEVGDDDQVSPVSPSVSTGPQCASVGLSSGRSYQREV